MERKPDPSATLPHSHAAEQAVLGGIFLAAARGDDLLSVVPLEVDDFYDPRHRAVFAAMRNLEAAERPIDVVTVGDFLAREEKLEPIGGFAYLGELALNVPTAENVEHYAKIVKEHRTSRAAALAMGAVVAQIYSGELAGDDAVNAGIDALRRIEGGKEVESVAFGAAAVTEWSSASRDAERAARGETVYTGIPTGLRALDEIIGGTPLEVLSLLVARPGMGKTTAASEICRNAAELSEDIPIFISLEDGQSSFGQRELAARTGVPTEDIRRRTLDADKVKALSRGLNRGVVRTPELVFMPGSTIDDVLRTVRRLKRRPPPHVADVLNKHGGTFGRLLVIDYLSKLARPEWARGESAEFQALSYGTLAASDFAAKEHCAVLMLQQLNRKVEERDSKMPQVSDIRGTGRAEEDAKLILALLWPHYYNTNENASDYRIGVLKNHNGQANRVAHLFADMATNSIADSAIDLVARRARRAGRAS